MPNFKKFNVRGTEISINNNVVKIYHDQEDVNAEQKERFDSIVQYLMDENFVTKNSCRVEIVCS